MGGTRRFFSMVGVEQVRSDLLVNVERE